MSVASVLVTGGAGMIGSNLVARLVRDGCRVKVVDNLWRGRRRHLLGSAGGPVIDMCKDFHVVDLTEPGALAPLLPGIDYVFHLADIVAGIDYVFNNQLAVFRGNLSINGNVIASVAGCPWIKGFVYTGTACSFPAHLQSGVDAPPMREDDQYPACPESAYGWSKLMGEYEAGLMEREAGIPVAILVLHNVYGTPCDLDPGRSQVIPALARKVIEHPDRPLVVWGSGEQGRAFVHVDDVVEALVSSMELGLGRGPIQIGPDACTRIADVARLLVSISGRPIPVHFDRSRPEGDRGRCADFAKAREVLGWRPSVDLRAGLADVLDWTTRQLRGDAGTARSPSVPRTNA